MKHHFTPRHGVLLGLLVGGWFGNPLHGQTPFTFSENFNPANASDPCNARSVYQAQCWIFAGFDMTGNANDVIDKCSVRSGQLSNAGTTPDPNNPDRVVYPFHLQTPVLRIVPTAPTTNITFDAKLITNLSSNPTLYVLADPQPATNGPSILLATIPTNNADNTKLGLTTRTFVVSASSLPEGNYRIRFGLLSTTGGATRIVLDNIQVDDVVKVQEGPACQEVPLPVSLVYFRAQTSAEGTQLLWQTSMERDHDYFEVERSANARQFQQISGAIRQPVQVDANRKTYGFTDAERSETTTYYRLKQVDLDGSVNYSRIISVARGDGSPALVLSPNPAGDHLDVRLNTPATGTLDIEVFGLTGKRWASVSVEKTAATHQQTLDTRTLPQGLYLVRVRLGDQQFIQKIVR